MKKFDVEIKKSVPNEQLPAGGYIGIIYDAEIKEYSWGEVLVISFDIAEGDYKDFFDEKYKNDASEDKKWKGNYRLTVPQEGSQYYDSQKRTFGNAIWSIEASNNGYHWDWDEKKLKGLSVGLIFGEKEWEYNGMTGFSTECRTLTDIESIRNGNFKIPKVKYLKNKSQEILGEEIIFSADELPF